MFKVYLWFYLCIGHWEIGSIIHNLDVTLWYRFYALVGYLLLLVDLGWLGLHNLLCEYIN